MRILIALLLMAGVAHAADDAVLQPVTTEQVAFTATASGTSGAVEAYNTVVRLVCDVACLVNIQKTPVVAGSTGVYIPAGVVSLFRVTPGVKVEVTAATGTGGTLHITEMSK